MSRQTVEDMLERAREFERRLEAYYADLRDRATNDGVRLLTYYLARHRRHLPEALDSFSKSQLKRLHRVPLESEAPPFHPGECFAGKELPSSVSGDELLRVAVELVEALIDFYRYLAEHVHDDDARGLIECLLHIEETHVVELKKTIAMNYF